MKTLSDDKSERVFSYLKLLMASLLNRGKQNATEFRNHLQKISCFNCVIRIEKTIFAPLKNRVLSTTLDN